MLVKIHSRGFSLTRALKNFVEDNMMMVLARYGENISRIDVTLSDINGPRGGLDKRCRVQVKIEKIDSIVIQDTHSDLYAAIASCATRARRAVGRKLEQRRKQRRQFELDRSYGVYQ